jgi:hypothetical protein
MATQIVAQPITRREAAYYFFGATVLTMLAALAGIFLWFALPRPQVFDLGPTDGFVINQPSYQGVIARNGNTTSLVIVRLADQVLVFDRYAGSCHYRYVWVPTNNRFEDPCSGYKWAINGTLLSYPPEFSPPSRDLDQYETFVHDGHLFVNLDKKQTGQIRAEQPPEVICSNGPFSCQLLGAP